MPSLSWLLTARWISILPTVPRPRWEPPPSSLQPIGPSHFGKGPCTFFHHGFFSTISETEVLRLPAKPTSKRPMQPHNFPRL